jgi:hypothetical protein
MPPASSSETRLVGLFRRLRLRQRLRPAKPRPRRSSASPIARHAAAFRIGFGRYTAKEELMRAHHLIAHAADHQMDFSAA